MKGSSLLKISLRYALVAGVLTSALLIVLFYAGRHPITILPFMDFRILLFGVFIFFSLKEFRDFHQGGVLYFWQGLFGSFIIVMVASLVASAGLWIFGTYEERFVSDYIEQMTANLKSIPEESLEQIGKDTFERNLELLPSTNIFNLVITDFAHSLIVGLFISLLLSVILRRTKT